VLGQLPLAEVLAGSEILRPKLKNRDLLTETTICRKTQMICGIELTDFIAGALKFLQKLIASGRQQRIICIPFLTKVNENCH
jgi:hypothetical protein